MSVARHRFGSHYTNKYQIERLLDPVGSDSSLCVGTEVGLGVFHLHLFVWRGIKDVETFLQVSRC